MGWVKRHGCSSRRRRETEDYGRARCKQTRGRRPNDSATQMPEWTLWLWAGSDRRLPRRVFSHQQMAIAPPNVTMTVCKKKRKEKQTSFSENPRQTVWEESTSAPPADLGGLNERAKPLKKASHLAAAAAAHTPTSTIPIGRVLRRSPNAAACFGNQNAHQVIPEGQNVQ